MICPDCKTRNPIGNKFCRECGRKFEGDSLAAEEAARAEAERREERVAVLLAEALALSEQDRPDEALPLAEEAAALLPASTSAQALLASLYERAEQTDKAVAAMERVVALNPDSAADQAKLEQLRRGVHVLPVRTRPAGSHAPSTWIPIVAAGAAAALVLGTGFALVNRGEPTTASAVRVATAEGAYPVPQGSAAPAPGSTQLPRAGRSDPFAPLPGAAATPPRSPADSAVPALPAPRQDSLAATPAPRRFRSSAALPVSPSATRPLPAIPSAAGQGAAGASERIIVRPPVAVRPPAESVPETGRSVPETRRNDNSGYIRIEVGPPRSAPPLRAAPSSPATDGEVPGNNPLLRAQSLQSSGRYREAIAAYRQALRSASGMATGDAYQGIGLSLQRLGNDAEARAAYQQAIAAYEAQAAAGRDTGAAQRGIASCRAALEVLGNG